MKLTTLLLAGALICSFPAVNAQTGHVMISPDKIQWGPAPPGLPAGAKVAVLSGDPAVAGMFTLRAKFPPGYIIPAHWHPTDELITVISGNLKMGMGDKYQKSALVKQRAGSFIVLPAKMNHYAAADEETIIQVHGTGPFEINYIDPKDDPRNK